MQEGTWVEYGTPGTLTLSHEEIESAVARLELLWVDAFAWKRLDAFNGECPTTNPFNTTEPAA